MPGRIVGNRYRVERLLGVGGHGEVYAAHDPHTKTLVALKRLRSVASGSTLPDRLKREAESLRQLQHPNIVRYLDFVVDGAEPFLITEYIDGITLAAFIRQHVAFPDPVLHGEVHCVLRAVCNALEFAHQRGWIHRDIKPSNIMLSGWMANWTPPPHATGDIPVKVLDFGLVHNAALGDLSVTGFGLGTLDYCAPEQKSNAKHVDSRADVYSVGTVLYELLTGLAPPPHPSKLPQRWLHTVMKSCEPLPQDRYESIRSFYAAFDSVCLGRTVERLDETPVEEKPMSRSQGVSDKTLQLVKDKSTLPTATLPTPDAVVDNWKPVGGKSRARQGFANRITPPSGDGSRRLAGRVPTFFLGLTGLCSLIIFGLLTILSNALPASALLVLFGAAAGLSGIGHAYGPAKSAGGIARTKSDELFFVGLLLCMFSAAVGLLCGVMLLLIALIADIKSGGWTGITVLIFAIVSTMISLYAAYSSACPACRKFFAKETTNKVELGRFLKNETRIQRTDHYRDDPNAIFGKRHSGHSNTYYDVQVLYRNVRFTHRCKFCQHQWQTDGEERIG